MYVSFPLRITTYFSVTIMLYNVLLVFVLFLVLCLLFYIFLKIITYIQSSLSTVFVKLNTFVS